MSSIIQFFRWAPVLVAWLCAAVWAPGCALDFDTFRSTATPDGSVDAESANRAGSGDAGPGRRDSGQTGGGGGGGVSGAGVSGSGGLQSDSGETKPDAKTDAGAEAGRDAADAARARQDAKAEAGVDASTPADAGQGRRDAATDADVDSGGQIGSQCTEDSDCLSQVCETNLCVECRAAQDCDRAHLCIENRCVPDRKPSTVWMSAGGGLSTAAGYKLRVSVGAPEPMGFASGTGYRVTIGPGLRKP